MKKLITILLYFFLLNHFSEYSYSLQIDGLKKIKKRITLSYFLKTDHSIKNLNSKFELSIKVVLVDSLKIEDILLKEGIYPYDVDIYKLLYELNPQINRLDSINSHKEIILPIIKLKGKKLDSNKLLIAILDKNKQEEIIDKINYLDTISKNRLPTLKTRINELKKLKDTIIERKKFFQYDQLIDLNEGINELINLYKNNVQSIRDSNFLLQYDSNMRYLNSMNLFRYRNNIQENGKVLIEINVLDSEGKKLDGYRIFYCSPGLYPKGVHSFTALSSSIQPIKVYLPKQVFWKIWGSRKNSKTNELLIKTDDNCRFIDLLQE